MSLVDVSPFLYPKLTRFSLNTNATLLNVSLTIDAASEYYGLVFRIPETGSITGISFRTATVTTGATITVQLETVDPATGLPTGTLYDANATGTCVIANTDDNVWMTDGYGGGTSWGSFTGTKGDLVCLKFINPAASFGNMSIAAGQVAFVHSFPYFVTNISGSAAKATGTVAGSMLAGALEYDSGTFYPMDGLFGTMMPVFSNGVYTWDNNDANTEFGARFLIPMACRVSGVMIVGDFDRVDNEISLYNSSGTELLTTGVVDKDTLLTYGGGNGDAPVMFNFTSKAELTAGAEYYIGIKPQASTATTDLAYLTVSTAAHMAAMPGGGNVYACFRATQGSGSWSTTSTNLPYISLIVDQLDDGASTGGGEVSSVFG